jgi:hypothetical protein
MSNQAIDFRPSADSLCSPVGINRAEPTDEQSIRISDIQFELVYQTLCPRDPTSEDIRRELFLLDCD